MAPDVTSRGVRYLVAVERKADIHRTLNPFGHALL
jgi:hypothetical protein